MSDVSSEHISNNTYTLEDLLKMKGYIVYTNVGNSMMPFLRQKRDIIEIRAKGLERCKKYDVVLYKKGSKYILHRILKVCCDGYVIAGDHNTFLEYDITDDSILGIMNRVIRNGREIRFDNKVYMLYVHLWCDFYPIRMAIIYVKRRVKSFLRRIIRKKALVEKRDS